jgi:hypothetical protein
MPCSCRSTLPVVRLRARGTAAETASRLRSADTPEPYASTWTRVARHTNRVRFRWGQARRALPSRERRHPRGANASAPEVAVTALESLAQGARTVRPLHMQETRLCIVCSSDSEPMTGARHAGANGWAARDLAGRRQPPGRGMSRAGEAGRERRRGDRRRPTARFTPETRCAEQAGQRQVTTPRVQRLTARGFSFGAVSRSVAVLPSWATATSLTGP